jgi:hypothetical protein
LSSSVSVESFDPHGVTEPESKVVFDIPRSAVQDEERTHRKGESELSTFLKLLDAPTFLFFVSVSVFLRIHVKSPSVTNCIGLYVSTA